MGEDRDEIKDGSMDGWMDGWIPTVYGICIVDI